MENDLALGLRREGLDRNVDAVCRGLGMHIEELRTSAPERPFTGQKRLMVEVLRTAFEDMESEKGEVRDQAAAWFEDTDDTERLDGFAFLQVCEELGFDARNVGAAAFDPDRRRAVLHRLRKEWREGETRRNA